MRNNWLLFSGDDTPRPGGGAEARLDSGERAELIRAALPPELGETVLLELGANRAPTRRFALVFPVLLLLFIGGALLIFPWGRFRQKLGDAGHLTALPSAGSYRETLERARALHARGEPVRARELLAPAARKLLREGTSAELRANEAVLECWWRWGNGEPERIRRECRRALRLNPDLLSAHYFLVLNTLPEDPTAALPVGGRERAELLEQARMFIRALRPYPGMLRLDEERRAAAGYALALAEATVWALNGFQDDEGEGGFAEREEALQLTRRFPGDRKIALLRYRILTRIWSEPWYLWNYQRIDGRRFHHDELKREIDALGRQLEQP